MWTMNRCKAFALVGAVLTFSPYVHADGPYSLPWQLRPAAAGNVVRSDTSIASYEDSARQSGATVATTLTASMKVPGTGGPGEGLAPLVRFAAVGDSPPTGAGGFVVVNPLLGASYVLKYDAFRLSAFLGVTVPVGGGGGDAPDAGSLRARSAGIFARASMDNALFAVNDFTVTPGIGAAYVADGFTVQVETTLLQLTRVRGDKAQPEASKTNLTAGIHLGYFIVPVVSLGADLRYQYWINGPIAIEARRDLANDNSSIDNMTFAIGPRGHFKLSETVWLRPGISYGRGFDRPTTSPGNYNIVQLDLPVQF